jgi:predicted RNase H-like HicB family nuclease
MNSVPEIIFLVEEDPEGGYFASAMVYDRPEVIGESIFTQGETIAELREMIRDAVQCHFDADCFDDRSIRLIPQNG